jgi:hypothetical protein
MRPEAPEIGPPAALPLKKARKTELFPRLPLYIAICIPYH